MQVRDFLRKFEGEIQIIFNDEKPVLLSEYDGFYNFYEVESWHVDIKNETAYLVITVEFS